MLRTSRIALRGHIRYQPDDTSCTQPSRRTTVNTAIIQLPTLERATAKPMIAVVVIRVEVAAVETFSSAMTGDITIPERSYRNRKPRSERRNSRTHRIDKTSVTKNGIAIGNKIPIELTVKTIIGTSEQQSSSDYHARARARICAITSIYIPWR